MLNLAAVLVLAALAASVLLLLHSRARLLPAIAVAASGLEALLVLDLVRLELRGVPLALLLGLALAVSGALIYLRVGGKTQVAAATVVTLVGAAQVIAAL